MILVCMDGTLLSRIGNEIRTRIVGKDIVWIWNPFCVFGCGCAAFYCWHLVIAIYGLDIGFRI